MGAKADAAASECPTCAGVWLDNGELERIRSERISAEDRHRAVVKAFERGAVDERMALVSDQIGPSIPYVTWRSRAASGALVAVYVAVAGGGSGNAASFLLSLTKIMRFCVLPLACVWFPDTLSNFVGGRITKTSPRSFVWFLGWAALLAPVVGIVLLGIESVGMFR